MSNSTGRERGTAGTHGSQRSVPQRLSFPERRVADSRAGRARPEAAGYVDGLGEGVGRIEVGDLVVSRFSSFCGHCGECQTDQNYRCADKPTGAACPEASRILWKRQPVYQQGGIGGFAEKMVVHHSSVVKLPRHLPSAAAALLGCRVLTGGKRSLSSTLRV